MNRLKVLPCACKDGFFDDWKTRVCTACNITCVQCRYNSNNCLSCAGNRVFNNADPPVCVCPTGTGTRNYITAGTPYCGSCSLAMLNVKIDENLRTLRIEFGFQIVVPNLESQDDITEENCNYLFDSDFMSYNFGNGPKCGLELNTTLGVKSKIVVQLGTFSSVIPGDSVELLSGTIFDKQSNCDVSNLFFTQFINNQVVYDAVISPAVVVLGKYLLNRKTKRKRK